ncbi:hypothetical protein GQX73_g632 [Xylaria multiplex]|uniref:RING-type domain-containing protein n=1 Tax=Xylaria multiplex TaxID=323545 RepID=A0A7C8MWF2_9PEZI|nr:hypothetical protein GQX73_g632 [Xylaria multiplex]
MGMPDALDWSHLNLEQPPESLSEYAQDNSPGSPELLDDDRVCYGMIYQVEVKLSENNMPKLNSKLQLEAQITAAERILTFTVERKVDHLIITFSDGVTLGILSDSMFESLGSIMERESAFFLEGVAPLNLLRERIGKINKSSDRKIRIDINVYGSRDTRTKIGEELSLKKVWLQKPDNYKTNFPYDNPHVVKFPEINHVSAGANDMRRPPDEEGQLAKQDRIQKIVSDVYVSLQRAGELETTSGDRRLQTDLLDHQQRALTFMKQRESGNIPEKYRLWAKSSIEGQEMYIHRVTKTRSTLQPEERGGGILADDMGMGKSLCALALLLDTLDEGRQWAEKRRNEEYHNTHVIRRPSNSFYSTCLELEARSRWCLTGTPIQNRLLDIGALFAFLRAEPFRNIAQFRRFIVLPFEQGDEVVKDRLVLLYDSLCLRRSKEILSLPGTDERERPLRFTEEEAKQYKSTLKTLQRSVTEKIGQYDKHREFGLFQAQLQLRILCNHGTYQKPFSWKRIALQHLDFDESIAMEKGTAFEARCDGCEQPKPALVLTTKSCGHFVCDSCLEYLEEIRTTDETEMPCPRCHYIELAKCMRNDTIPTRSNNNQRRHHRDALTRNMYFKNEGVSTKMNALVQDVRHRLEEMKSIVFSCWTHTMDLVGRHLDHAGIEYLRIDGDTLMSKRQRVLDAFDDDSGARVLLRVSAISEVLEVTTGTGAFGLNITAARRVFILEPQWNPSVENQAIARTTRLNQKEKVLVIRYRIEDTVETEMLSQQKQKREIARIGW